MNFKRKRPKSSRAGCLLCKPHKVMGNSKHASGSQKLKFIESLKQQVI